MTLQRMLFLSVTGALGAASLLAWWVGGWEEAWAYILSLIFFLFGRYVSSKMEKKVITLGQAKMKKQEEEKR